MKDTKNTKLIELIKDSENFGYLNKQKIIIYY